MFKSVIYFKMRVLILQIKQKNKPIKILKRLNQRKIVIKTFRSKNKNLIKKFQVQKEIAYQI